MFNSLKILMLALTLTILVSPAAPIGSNDAAAFVDAGAIALEQKDYAKAHELFEKSARAGNSYGQTFLASLYSDGHGVPRDYVKARYWLEKAALGGNSQAQFLLGLFHEYGAGGPQDYKKARQWYQKAAESGNIMAPLNLARLYYNGQGGPADINQATKWWEKVAEYPDEIKVGDIDGKVQAQNNLGLIYFDAKDYEKARYWFEKAAEADKKEVQAKLALGFIYFNGLGVPQDLQKSRYWLKKFADEYGETNLQMVLSMSFNLYKGR